MNNHRCLNELEFQNIWPNDARAKDFERKNEVAKMEVKFWTFLKFSLRYQRLNDIWISQSKDHY
jgi:hypothetical protein